MAFISGAAGLVGGTVLWFTANPEEPGSQVALRLSLGPREAQFVGTW